MTTLMTAALCLFGVMAYRPLPVAICRPSTSSTIQVSAPCRCDAGDHGECRPKVLEGQFSTIAGIDSMTSTSGTGITQITLQFRSSGASTPRAGRAGGHRGWCNAACRRTCRRRPPPEDESADQPILFIGLSSPRCRCRSSTSTRTR